MSDILVSVMQLQEVLPHPNADRLFIGRFPGYQTVIGKNDDGTPQFTQQEKVVYVPPGCVIPEELADKLNIKNYLKERINFDGVKTLTVRSVKLRGAPSHGLILKPLSNDWELGQDVAAEYGIYKYEPPARGNNLPKTGFNCAPEIFGFPRYDAAENLRNYSFIMQEGEPVRIEEKIDGSQSRVGKIRGQLVAGSNRFRRKDVFDEMQDKIDKLYDLYQEDFLATNPQYDQSRVAEKLLDIEKSQLWGRDHSSAILGKMLGFPTVEELTIFVNSTIEGIKNGIDLQSTYSSSLYWYPLSLPEVRACLDELGTEENSVVLYGELFGGNIQSLRYGRNSVDYRVFDIMIDNRYLDYEEVMDICERFGLKYVPVLFVGAYSLEMAKELSVGKTTLMADQSKAHIREGVIVKPLKERVDNRGNRVTMKWKSDDYLTNDKIQDADTTDV